MPLTAKRPSQELIDLVGALGGTWSGYVAMCRCPAHADSDPSLSIRQGDRAILVTCFAGCDREDILRELSRVKPGTRYPMPAGLHGPRPGNPTRLWDEALDFRSTLGQHYLERRRLDPFPNDLRFHPRCPLGPKPTTQFLPALLVAVREGRALTAIQRIFLAPDGSYTSKVMLGVPGQGAWQGAGAGQTLALAEGFETAAAYRILNGTPCWSTMGARRFNQMRIPPQVSLLLLAHDNDAEGRRAANLAAETYRRPGLVIEPAPPPAGFNDWCNLLEAANG